MGRPTKTCIGLSPDYESYFTSNEPKMKTETKVMLDIDEKLFSPDKVSALQEDLDFIFGSYEVK